MSRPADTHEKSTPRPLPERILRELGAQLLGYFGSAQRTGVIGLHFGWMVMVALGAQESGGSLRDASRVFFKLYAALGGVDEDGHGDLSNVLAVWGKLSLVLFAFELVLRRLRAPASRWSASQQIALSTGVAAAGYGAASAVLPRSTGGAPLELVWMIAFFVLATGVATAWAVGVGAVVETMQSIVRARPAQEVLPVATSPKPSVLLGSGAAVLVFGLAVGVVTPRGGAPAPRVKPVAAPRDVDAQSQPSLVALERACQRDQGEACQILGERLSHGLDAPVDAARGRTLMQRGCDLGYAISCATLAAELERGDPSTASLSRAEALYRKACDAGNADGCAGVAYLYEGVQQGPPPDPAVSQRFFAKACALGKDEVCGKR